MPLFFDSHAHLQLEDFASDQAEVIGESTSTFHLKRMINVGIDIPTSMESIRLAERYPGIIYPSVGIHPNNTHQMSQIELGQLEDLLRNYQTTIKALGEIGLDYYRDYSPPEKQRQCFIQLIQKALKYQLPIIIHSRQAFDDTWTILQDHLPPDYPVVFHCFSGDTAELVKLIDAHYYIGIAGPVTYSTSRLPHLVPDIPLSSLLIETDSPFLAPVPHRGKRNVPGNVSLVAEKIGQILGRSTEDIATITDLNAGYFFRLDPVLSYSIGSHLYFNLTNRCTNRCSFCPLTHHHLTIGPYNLQLSQEPSAEEIIQSIPIGGVWQEAVFCGFGEPTLRLDVLKEVARHLKTKNFRIRLNTNGQGNLIYRRNILPELAGLIDIISISLNAHDDAAYRVICQPQFQQQAFPSLLSFIRESRHYIPQVVVSIVTTPEIDIPACRKLAESLQVPLRIRPYREGAL